MLSLSVVSISVSVVAKVIRIDLNMPSWQKTAVIFLSDLISFPTFSPRLMCS